MALLWISGVCAIQRFMQDKNCACFGHVHGLRETLRVCAATENVTLTLMKYTHACII